MPVNQTGKPAGKLCFVTIGATAAFDSLVRTVLSEPFQKALIERDFTDLCIQFGRDDARVFYNHMESRKFGPQDHTIRVSGFHFNRDGLGQEMRAVKGGSDGAEGVVISHAGTGSILDAMRIDAPIIVVPNPELLDNHQVELAEQMEKQSYAVYGKLDNLSAALDQSAEMRKKKNEWLSRRREVDPKGKEPMGVGDDQLGFVD